MFITKYSASGNDFVIFHTFKEIDRSKLAITLCDRHNSIGADGLVVLLPHDEYDFMWQFYNSDGSEANMCGNASRAVAHYAYTNGLANTNMNFLTKAGVISANVSDDMVESLLTPPQVIKEEFEEQGLKWYLVNTGVPHLVTLVDDLSIYNKDIASSMRYKHNANVNYAKVENGYLRVRTYERGVENETLACGTGMAASFLRAHLLGLLPSEAKVYPTSNEELILRYTDNKLYFKGKVQKVFITNI